MSSKNYQRRKEEKENYCSSHYIIQANENKKLSLRKKKNNQKFENSMKSELHLLNEHKYKIHIHLLKTNNDNIRNFIIDVNKPEYTMNNLKCLLNSKNDDEVKFGIYATREFFVKVAKEMNEERMKLNNPIQMNNNINDTYLNNLNSQKNIIEQNNKNNEAAKNQMLQLFLSKDITNFIFQIIKGSFYKNEKSDQMNIYECLYILINMSAIYSINENHKLIFYSYFFIEDNFCALLSLFDSKKFPSEILINVLILLANIAVDSKKFKTLLKKSSLPSLLFTYLQTESNLNSSMVVKIIKVLYLLYWDDEDELSVDAYIILFKIFSLSLISFKNKDLVYYCLEILEMLSKKDITEVIQCFDNFRLLSVLSDIVFTNEIKENELYINLILNIFSNLIQKDDVLINKDFIENGTLIQFYNDLIIKYKKEEYIMNYKIEDNILISINNLIITDYDHHIQYIFDEGKEILNLILKDIRDISQNIRYFGFRTCVNILFDIKLDINNDILYEIADSIINSLINNFYNCFYICCHCLYLLIKKSEIQTFSNDFRKFLIDKGATEQLEKIRNKLIKDSQDKKLEEKEEGFYNSFLDEIYLFFAQA